MQSDTPPGFVAARITDDGITRMDPHAYDMLKELQEESGTADDDVPGMLHQFLEPYIDDMEKVVGKFEKMGEVCLGLKRKRRSVPTTVLRMRDDDRERLEQLLWKLSDISKYLGSDGKRMVQVFLVMEGEKK